MVTLLPFGEIRAGDLEWAQLASFKHTFSLHQGDRVFAMLAWRSALGTLAVATTAGGAWSFKRVGFWSTRVTVRREGAVEDDAIFTPRGWTGSAGDLRFADGGSLSLEREGFWSASWKFREPGEGGATLARVGDIGGVFRWRASLSLASKDDPRSPLLACLLWYLAVMAYQDEASVVAATG